jgi:ribulose-5-phosphate 4-epimerase/fuculose-1-phosphate aldolase
MDHFTERADLAAALRYTARLGMHEGIANHYSLAVSADGAEFLINPYGRHWSQMRASDLLLVDAHQPPVGRDDIDPTALAIHGAIHRKVPHARCIMHLHSKYATALAALKDPVLPPVDQNSMRFFNRVAIDDGYDGMGLGNEAERLAAGLGNHSVMLMGQHGVLVAGATVAQCFDDIYYFERAAETYITALATGRTLNIATDEVAEKTARQWAEYPAGAQKHLEAIHSILTAQEPEYRH